MGAMRATQHDSPQGASVQVHLRYATDEGPLHVRARRVGDRWFVEARCGGWRQAGVGPDLAAAADAALRPYASGMRLINANRNPRGTTPR